MAEQPGAIGTLLAPVAHIANGIAPTGNGAKERLGGLVLTLVAILAGYFIGQIGLPAAVAAQAQGVLAAITTLLLHQWGKPDA